MKRVNAIKQWSILVFTMGVVALTVIFSGWVTYAQGGYEGSPGMPTVEVNLKQIQFPDQQPYIKNNRTMIPVRFISEAMGANVFWERDGKSVVTIEGKETSGKAITLYLQLGDAFAMVNGEKKAFDAPAELIEGRVCIPLRFVSEALGASVRWQPESYHVIISSIPFIEKNGYTIPTTRYTEVNADMGEGEIMIGILLEGDKAFRDKQFAEMRMILESRFEKKLVDDIMTYMMIKTDRKSGHEEVLKEFKSGEYRILCDAMAWNVGMSVSVTLVK